MIINKFIKRLNSLLRGLFTGAEQISLSPETKKGNRELDEMLNNYYWTWEEQRF